MAEALLLVSAQAAAEETPLAATAGVPQANGSGALPGFSLLRYVSPKSTNAAKKNGSTITGPRRACGVNAMQGLT